jgi:hypothetical protein
MPIPPVVEAKNGRWGLFISYPRLHETWLAKRLVSAIRKSSLPKPPPDSIIAETAEAKDEHWDLFISYRRKDGSKLAWWVINKINNFSPPPDIIESIPPEKKALYFRRPTIFVDTSYESKRCFFFGGRPRHTRCD